ncbi:MAG: hypothetical protein HC941_28195 [Microcoleus sp. SU_5_3]|nr:hypothetical protein [Microcoleus sp. SU_5_3]
MTNDYCFPANGRAGTGAPAPTNGRARGHRPYQRAGGHSQAPPLPTAN